jgi:hypothetical protein
MPMTRVKKSEVPDTYKSLYGSIRFCKFTYDDFMPAKIRDPFGLPMNHAARKTWEESFQKVSVMLVCCSTIVP